MTLLPVPSFRTTCERGATQHSAADAGLHRRHGCAVNCTAVAVVYTALQHGQPGRGRHSDMVELSKVTRIDEENVDPSSPARTRRPDRIGSDGHGAARTAVVVCSKVDEW